MSNNLVGFSLALILVAGVGTTTSGCKDQISSVCSLVCFCQQCAQGEEQQCETYARQERDEAHARDCDKEFEANQTCLEEKVHCEGTTATVYACSQEKFMLDNCLLSASPPPGGG